MLKTLTYSATFASTGRTLAETLDFQKGLGAITGANESGKSFSIEMIRWILFGSAALRGKADTYEKLSGSLELVVKGVTYRITRSQSKASIVDVEEEEILATGTKPVNLKIIEILGYDLPVFDISNVANQGDIEKLITMKPTERKQMVDQVVGLTRLDALNAWAADEARLIGREVEALSKNLVAPVPPPLPERTDEWEIEGELNQLREREREYHQLKGVLSIRKQPVELQSDPFPNLELAVIEKRTEEQLRLQAEVKRLSALPEPSQYDDATLQGMLEQWEAYDAHQSYLKLVETHPKPAITMETYLRQMQSHRDNEEIETLGATLNRLKAGTKAVCPCGQEFLLDHTKVAAIEGQLAASVFTTNLMSLADLRIEKHRLDDWANREEFVPVPEVDRPALSREVIRAELTKNARSAGRSELAALRQALADDTIDWPTVRAEKLAFIANETAYFEYLTWKLDYEEKERQAARLNVGLDKIPTLDRQLQNIRVYKVAEAHYQKQAADYTKRLAEIEEAKAAEAGYRACKAALTVLRSKVKAYLVPALNKVASHLLSELTGGARQSIVIDADFEEILVDGQSIETLSGSGKACANLAIRIGLGQVLTNNVLSLFIGDEIDASMDEDRQNFLSELLYTLKDRILQVLVVTHKSPTVDYTIRIGEKAYDSRGISEGTT